MKKLYNINLSFSQDIIVAANNEQEAVNSARNEYCKDVLENTDSSQLLIIPRQITSKKEIVDELNNTPYGDTRTIKEIWKDIEKEAKDKAHKEWLEKHHMTFDFYKDTIKS